MAWNSLSVTSRKLFARTLNSKACLSNALNPVGITCTSVVQQKVIRFSHNKSKNGTLGQSTILIQDGCDFQELPVIVRNVTEKDINLLEKGVEKVQEKVPPSDVEYFDPVKEAEAKEIIEGFNRCYSPKGIFALLDIIPSNEVTPYVALQALKKIITLENNKEFRNPIINYEEEEDRSKNFTRTAVLNQLVEIIASSTDEDIVLSGLKLVSRDLVGGNSESYKEKLCNEVLIRATDSKFNVFQICEAVKIFSSVQKMDVDKLWVGIVERGNDINDKNIMEVFKCLPLLNKSRKIILNLLEKKLILYWWRLNGKDVADILCILKENSLSVRVLSVLSRWLNTNIHAVSEEELLEIVNSFRALEYCHQGVYKALERYVKYKGIKIENQNLMACIGDYFSYFRVRSSHTLEGMAEFLIAKNQSLSPITIKSLFTALGLLNFQPVNGFKFWQIFETVFEEKFIQFRPEDALDVMMSCLYLEKYPLNFVNKVFNPYFLDRLHSCKSDQNVQLMRTKLKVLDFTMTLECSSYEGPLLPKDPTGQSAWTDGRVRRILNFINRDLENVIGRMNRVSFMRILPQVPITDLYIIDAVVHPSSMGMVVNYLRNRNMLTVVLVSLPEHHCTDGSLIGPQAMRKRHFRKMGLKVVTLDYATLSRLKIHPPELKEYLIDRFKSPEEPL